MVEQKFNKDELTWPDWFDTAFFAKIVRTYKHDQTVEIKSFEVAPGSAAGEHFASVMYKVKVIFDSKKFKVEGEELLMVIKIMPYNEGFKMDMLKNSPMFKNEIQMYTTILPEMERILEQAGEKFTLAPPLIYQSLTDHPSPVLVLKDVRPEGFYVPPWGVETFDTVKIATRFIARFHAASMYMAEGGKDFDFGEHFFLTTNDKGQSMPDEFMKPGLIFTAQGLGADPEYKDVSDKILKNMDRYMDIVKDSYRPNNGSGYVVLNHGDFHSKNILIRNGGVKDEDLLLIDYQFPIWTSPAVDVYYLINMMTNPQIRAQHRDDMVRYYYSEFSSTLKRIGYRGRIPTMMDLRVELLKWSAIDFVHSLGFVSMQFIDPKAFDFDKMAEDPQAAMAEAQQATIESAGFQKHLRDCVKRFNVQGTLY